MGCDIHLFVEHLVGGVWSCADEIENSDGYRYAKKPFYRDRNYDLFAILADVRNGRGFAGIKTGDGFNPIAQPKGLPPDVSGVVRGISEGWGEDGHSHSFHTVSDLMAYDWTQKAKLQGYVDAFDFWNWDGSYSQRNGEGPASYCGDISGSRIKKISQDEMRARIAVLDFGSAAFQQRQKIIEEQLYGLYALAEWVTPYYVAAEDFLSRVLPRLWRLGNPGDVRIVFWFDN